MAIEIELQSYLTANLTGVDDISWGKANREYNPAEGDLIVNLFKLPSFSAQNTPSFLDVIQLSVRGNYPDVVTEVANQIIELFQLQTLSMGSYNVWVNDITHQGLLYEQDDEIVHVPLQLELKYSGL